MSGNLKLKGATSGSSQLSAPDTGTDQQFTFPATGGELVTIPINSQVASYQQGYWLPTVDAGGGSNAWLIDGVEAIAGHMPNYTATWSRNGNQVTVVVYLTFGVAGNEPVKLQVTNLPYRQRDLPANAPSTAEWDVFAGSLSWSKISIGAFSSAVPYMYKGKSPATTDPNGGMIFHLSGNAGGDAGTINCNTIVSGSNIAAQITYLTDDTTWQPSNGATLS